jgi:hypothetical protein
MTSFGGLVREIAPHCLLTLSDQLVCFQSHHYSLFVDQTISDALGGEGWAVRRQAAFEASHALLTSVVADAGAQSAREKIELAGATFQAMGLGRMTFEVSAEGGVVRGEDLHHGLSFLEKYGGRARPKKPLDAFAAGFCAAAVSLAFPSDWGLFEAEETRCIGRGDDACTFALTRKPERMRFGTVIARATVEAMPVSLPEDATTEGTIEVAQAVSAMLDGLEADDRGRVRAFGVNLCLMPTSYTNQVVFDTMHLVERRTPELFAVFGALMGEAAQLGAFHILGGVLVSPAFRDAVGMPAPTAEGRLEQLLGIAQALGWGAIYAPSFVPGRSLVLRSPATHESIYYALRHGTTVRTRLTFLQGLALAMMQLLHRVDFDNPEPLGPDSYSALFRSGTRFHVEETRSTVRGDGFCEVIVQALAP